jgi:hypothetical protein
VPENGAFILAEDQDAVATNPITDDNAFDFNGGKGAIATRSDNFVVQQGMFSAAEQDTLLPIQLNGVCSTKGGCSGTTGIGLSMNLYRLFPLSVADIQPTPLAAANGKFLKCESASQCIGNKTLTTDPRIYWNRGPLSASDGVCANTRSDNGITADNGEAACWKTANYDHSFRPAGVLNLESVLL